MRIEARAPAKLVLIGEYAVLDGAPAIVAAVDRLVRVRFEPADPAAPRPWTVATDLGGGQEATLDPEATEHADWLRPVVAVLARAAAAVDRPLPALPGGRIHIESAALHVDAGETKLGLGSSAAVVAALGGALQQALVDWGLAPRDAPPLERDFDAHRALQDGAGSGVDVAASVRGGVLRYQLVEGRPQATPLSLPTDVAFAVVWTGVPASTTAFVEGVRTWRGREPEAYAREITALTGLSTQAIAACERDDAADFLAAVRGYREAMDALGRAAGVDIVSRAHREVADLAEGTGVSYKPSGAGGGDVGLLFASSRPALVQAGRLAERAGYRLLDLHVHPVGVQVTRPERSEP